MLIMDAKLVKDCNINKDDTGCFSTGRRITGHAERLKEEVIE